MKGMGVRIPTGERSARLGPLLKQYATQGAEWVSLHAPVEFFQTSNVEGFIPFVERGKLFLGLGEPVAAPADKLILVEEFLWFAKRRAHVPGFFPVSDALFDQLEPLGVGGVETALEPRLDLQNLDRRRSERPALEQALQSAGSSQVTLQCVQMESLSEELLPLLPQLERPWSGGVGPGRPGLLTRSDILAGGGARRVVAARDGKSGEILALVSWVPVSNGRSAALDCACRARGTGDRWVYACLAHGMEWLAGQGVESLLLGPMVFETRKRGADVPIVRSTEFPFVGTMFRWILAGVPALEDYRKAQQGKMVVQPDGLEPRYLLFHPARPSPDLLLSFVGALFPELSFKSLVQELVAGLSTRRRTRGEDMDKEEH